MGGKLLVLAALTVSGAARGQITSLATDATGSFVVFSSAATLKGLEYGDDERIYEVRLGGGPVVVAEFPSRRFEWGLMWPALSGDGRVRVWTAEDQCTCCSSCWMRQRYFARMLDASGEVRSLGEGQATVSRNGRWVSWGGGTGFLWEDMGWLNLETGETIRRPNRAIMSFPPGSVGVANDGARVLPGENGTGIRVVWPDGRLIAIEGNVRPWRAAIDPHSRYALVEEYDRQRIWIADLASRSLSVLIAADEGVEQPQPGGDSNAVGFISAANWVAANNSLKPQFWLIDLATGGLTQVSAEPTGVRTATLSGDGRIVYFVNGLGELVRQAVGGERSVVLPAVPWPVLPAARTILVPGTRGIMTGTNLADARLFVAGVEARVVAREQGRIEFITPAVDEQQGQIVTVAGPENMFEAPRLWASTTAIRPSLWTWADHWPETPYPEHQFAWAIHSDTGAIVTPQDPLRPGEWIEVQVTGVRLEDGGPLEWRWPTPGGLIPLVAELPRPDPDMEGLLRVKLRAPAYEPGESVWLVPIAGLVAALSSPLPVAQ